MKKYLYFFLIILLTVSISFNLTLNLRLRVANAKITEINDNTSKAVERNIRQSIVNTRELIETGTKESLFNLQQSIEDLAVAFEQWYMLNQTEELPNSVMQRGVSGVEAIRNTIIHNLNRQYIANGEKLKDEDIEMLDRFQETMNRLLLVYHNIEGRVANLSNPTASDGGLMQIASNLEELSRLYRHSIIPNRHPEYIGIENGIRRAQEQIEEIAGLRVEEGNNNVLIREGVHYYLLNYYYDEQLNYTLWVDASNGVVRNFEYRIVDNTALNLSADEPIEIARNFLSRFYEGDVKEEMLYIVNESDNTSFYSFRFIPIINGYEILSDAYNITVCPRLGKVVRFSNDFNNSSNFSSELIYTKEDIINKYSAEQGIMAYEGLVVVRSFRTRFKPVLTHAFSIIQKDQQLILYYDIETGFLVHQMYQIFEEL